MSAADVSTALREQGVLIGGYGQHRMRAVTHLDVTRADIDSALRTLARSSREALPAVAGRRHSSKDQGYRFNFYSM